MNEGKLAGKRALVTGAGTGIGREVAIEFARQGADVVVHYSHEPGGAESAIKEIQALGRRAKMFKADFNDASAASALADFTLDYLGGIDSLINNAGISFNSPFHKITADDLDVLLRVNLRSPFLLTQKLTEPMLQQGSGSVCSLASIHGLQGAPEHSAYAATKGAIVAYTRALAVELGHRGVRVNAIAPGWISVEGHAAAIPGFDPVQAAADAREKVPMGRHGLPIDVAKIAAFLCSNDATFITGQTIVVDGGTTSLMSLMTDFRSESAARFGTGYMPNR
jgi:NAD(P)-dependent dehydrogenase (short-subunit alcohol dehydrogenase family)